MYIFQNTISNKRNTKRTKAKYCSQPTHNLNPSIPQILYRPFPKYKISLQIPQISTLEKYKKKQNQAIFKEIILGKGAI